MKIVHALIALATVLAGNPFAQAAPLDDLKGGQTGRITFTASTPASRWALIRGQLGPEVTIYGDLVMPKSGAEKVPAVIFSHGSDGITRGTLEVWAKPLTEAGYAVFLVESFKPRGEQKISGTPMQLTWNTTLHISDALYALRLMATHPRIDARRIFHMGWSRGGTPVLDAAWPTFQQRILPPNVKWAGGIAIYPGCNFRYRVDQHSPLPSPVLMLLAEKDDMTPAKPCMEYAEELAAKGHKVSYKVYPGAYHVFDRLDQPWRRFKEGNFAQCAVDVQMPYGPADPLRWGPGYDRNTGRMIFTPEEFNAIVAQCGQMSEITIESNAKAREQAVKDVLTFLNAN